MGQREINKKLKEMDIIFGDDNEAIGKNLIEDYLGMPLRNYKDKYATFDFFNIDMKVIVELKSRRNSSQKYKTQLIGKNKWDKAKEKVCEGYKVYFFWLLSDGLYVYEVNKNQVFETTYLGNYARNDKPKELILIPNIVLKKTIPQEERTTEVKKVEPYIVKWD